MSEATAGDPTSRVALDALSRAARQGHVEAMFTAGMLAFRHTADMPRHSARRAAEERDAAKWLLDAARKHHPAAARCAALLYERGLGVPQDFARAARWYSVAAVQDSGHGGGEHDDSAGVEEEHRHVYEEEERAYYQDHRRGEKEDRFDHDRVNLFLSQRPPEMPAPVLLSDIR